MERELFTHRPMKVKTRQVLIELYKARGNFEKEFWISMNTNHARVIMKSLRDRGFAERDAQWPAVHRITEAGSIEALWLQFKEAIKNGKNG